MGEDRLQKMRLKRKAGLKSLECQAKELKGKAEINT